MLWRYVHFPQEILTPRRQVWKCQRRGEVSRVMSEDLLVSNPVESLLTLLFCYNVCLANRFYFLFQPHWWRYTPRLIKSFFLEDEFCFQLFISSSVKICIPISEPFWGGGEYQIVTVPACWVLSLGIWLLPQTTYSSMGLIFFLPKHSHTAEVLWFQQLLLEPLSLPLLSCPHLLSCPNRFSRSCWFFLDSASGAHSFLSPHNPDPPLFTTRHCTL